MIAALTTFFWWAVVPLVAAWVFVRLVVARLILPHLDPDSRMHAVLAYLVEASSDLLGWLRSTRTPGLDPAGDAPDAGPAVASDPARPRPLPPPPAVLPPPSADAPAGVPSAGGAQSDLLYAIDALVAEASNGDIKAVRRVAATMAQAVAGMGGALARLGQRLGEPDKDYGSDIYEPVLSAGSQCRAAGIRLTEADALLVSLISATVGELADSPRRAPHSSQLNGGNR
jgi:hypothetical protein